MGIPQNIATFLKGLPLKSMRGEDVFVGIAFFLAGGSGDVEVGVKAVEDNWSRGLIGKKYNSAYFTRARGRIHPVAPGRFLLTKEEGIPYVQGLIGEIPMRVTTLVVYQAGTAHSFDKFLRDVLKKATRNVDIADTYVSGVLFDTLLNDISITTQIRFVYGNDKGDFVSRATRFNKQYKFQTKESKEFHDRFLIIDGKGYVIGPSLKDAADKKPATVVVLNASDSKKLADLFEDIWNKAK